MAWVRAVLKENGKEEEGVIPSCWINDSSVHWLSKMNVLRAAQERKEPDKTWLKFSLVKIKCRDGEKINACFNISY